MLELMIVVAIIGIAAALAAPAISNAMADRRAAQATLDIVRLGRRARSEAMAFGRAHLLRFAEAGSSGSDGSLRLYRGRSSACRTNNWDEDVGTLTAILSGGFCDAGSFCLEAIDVGEGRYSAIGTHSMRISAPDAGGDVDICYDATGGMMYRDPGGAWIADNAESAINAGGIRLRVQRLVGGSVEGSERWVLFPWGATARTLR